MQVKAEVLAEDSRTKDGVEYVTLTCRELDAKPLLQMFDYGLRKEELEHKGKLLGKTVNIQVNNIRAIFSGRPQFSGSMAVPAK